MTKDIYKILKELKYELRQEWKAFREALERDIRNDIGDLGNDVKEAKNSMDFMNREFEDTKKTFETVLKENVEFKRENGNLSQKSMSWKSA